MENTKPGRRWVRGVLAAFLIFIFLGFQIPNLRKIRDIVFVFGILVVPLSCIHFGAGRSRLLETMGWLLLIGFIFLTVQ